MVRVNLAEAQLAEAGRLQEQALPLLSAELRPADVDGRLQPWEWIATPAGPVLKTDAIDHARAHDLIGGQDIAWDVAGAVVEFGLDHDEATALARHVGGAAAQPRVRAAFEVAYAAFQVGAWSLALDSAGPSHRPAIAGQRDLYLRHLRKCV